MSAEEASLLDTMSGEEYDPAHQQPEEDEEEEDDEDYDPDSFIPAPTHGQMASASGTPTPALDSPAVSQLPSQTTSQAVTPQQAAAPHAPPATLAAAAAAATPSTPATAQPPQKPKTIGGFIEEDDGEEEDQMPAAAATGSVQNGSAAQRLPSPSASMHTPMRSATQTPAQNVILYNPTENTAAPSETPVQNGAVAAAAAAAAAAAVAAVPDSLSNTPSQLPHSPLPQQQGTTSTDAAANANAESHNPEVSVPSSSLPAAAAAVASATAKPRLPQDRVGLLEDRIQEDPRGDIEAWLDLVAFYRSKNKFDDARKVYERFFAVFPTAADQWVAYANMEGELDDFARLEAIFGKALVINHNTQLWSVYLDYIRRRNNVMTDTSGQARTTINSAYEYVLNQVGIDKDSGHIWQDYISFIKSAPGNPGGNGWQDQQKMDLMRKAYQRAICVPMQAVTTLWKEYDAFEMSLNKVTGRKFLQEKSPAYMTARSSHTALQNLTRDLKRTTLPSLPPAPGCEGEEYFHNQVQIWQRWIDWEKEDPLVLKDDDIKAYHDRVIYAYRQAVIALRFWPQIWYDAAEFCYTYDLQEGDKSLGDKFLEQGLAANPESCLLAFKRADRLEMTIPVDETEQSIKDKGEKVKEPYIDVVNALYSLITKAKEHEKKAKAQIEDNFANLTPLSREPTPEPRDEDEEDEQGRTTTALSSRDAEKKKQLDVVENGTRAQVSLLSRLVSQVWIALMRAMRRVQGKGKVDAPVGGCRHIFAEARKRGRLTSDVYIAAALIEYHCYKDPASTKIFERGIKLFPEDEMFALEYLKHLIAITDVTNARAVFETTVSKLTTNKDKPELVPRARPLYLFMHEYESQYGDLAQINKLEKRMAELYPSDPSLSVFAHRFKTPNFDACGVRPVISPRQLRPRSSMSGAAALPSVEVEPPRAVAAVASTSAPSYLASPKRAFDNMADGSDVEQGPARKLARGESPLKGAAGRRQQQRQRAEAAGSQNIQLAAVPKPLPNQVAMLLSIIPRAECYLDVRLDPARMVDMLRTVDLATADLSRAAGFGGVPAQTQMPPGYGAPPPAAYASYGGYPYGR